MSDSGQMMLGGLNQRGLEPTDVGQQLTDVVQTPTDWPTVGDGSRPEANFHPR